jgi:TolA-binding protein
MMLMRKLVALLVLCALTVPAWAQAPAEQTLGLANGLFDQELWDQALDKYNGYIKAAGQSANLPFALFRAGECHYNLQRFDKALPFYQRLTTEFAQAEVYDEALYRLGDTSFQLNKMPEAQKAFSALLEKSPKSPLAYRAAYWLGEAQYRLGKYPEAVTAYEKSLQLSPDGDYAAYAAYSIGLSKFKLGDSKDGISRLEAILAKYPKHDLVPEVLYRLGEAQYGVRNYDAALANYQRVLKGYGGTQLAPLAQSGIAWSYWNQGKYAEALPVFEQLRKSDDKTLAQEAGLRVADCLFLLQKYGDAATAYGGIASGKGEQAANAHFWQAMSLERKPDKPAALKSFQNFVTANPTHERAAEALLHLGALQVDGGQLEAAATSYKSAEARSNDPEIKAQGAYGAAWTAYQRTKSDADLAAIEKIAEDSPQSTLGGQVAYQTGKLRFAKADYSRAIQLLSALVQNHPQHPALPEALYLLGASYAKAGNVAKAEEFYKRALDAQPTGEYAGDAAGALVDLYARGGKIDAATNMLSDMKKKHPADPALPVAQYALAEALFAAKNYTDAASYYSEVLASKSTELSPYAQYSLGACRFGTGEYKPAAEAFRKVLSDYPKSDAAPAAKYQLALSLSKLGQPAEAAKLLEELVKALPQSSAADSYLVELGAAYDDLKQPQEALAIFQKLLASYPDSSHAPEAAFRSGEIAYAGCDYPAAQAAYQQVLTKYPKSELADEAAYKLGWSLLKQDKPQEALANFKIAAESANDAGIGADARYQAAALLMKQGTMDEAVKLLEPIRATAPAALAPRALLLLGQGYLGLKDSAKAAPAFQQVVDKYKADPLAPRAMLGLGRCQKADKKFDEASTTFTRVTGTKDTQAAMEAQFELAETRRLQNDFRAAAMEYLKVAILYSDADWGARAQYAAGLCYEQAQATDDAVKAYKVVVERYKEQQEWAGKASDRLRALE